MELLGRHIPHVISVQLVRQPLEYAFSLEPMFYFSLSSIGDDKQALIWDIQQMPKTIEDPILAYTAEGEINQVQWSTTQPDWIAICFNNSLEILRV